MGETLGSALVARGGMALTPWAGVGLAAIAQLPLAWLAKRSSGGENQAARMAGERDRPPHGTA